MKEQLIRIQQKLAQAKATDKNLEVFGADAHQYHLNPPVSEEKVRAFEEKYGLQLPECYRAFMLTIGDAKAKKSDFIAGPYFGLYAFGTCVDELLYEKIETYLKAPCNLSPLVELDEQVVAGDELPWARHGQDRRGGVLQAADLGGGRGAPDEDRAVQLDDLARGAL